MKNLLRYKMRIIKRAIRKIISQKTKKVFHEYNINQNKFDRSIEIKNDSDIIEKIQQINQITINKSISLDQKTIQEMLEFYMKLS